MEIRPFQPADEPAVVALWEHCSLVRPWNDPHLDIARRLMQQVEDLLRRRGCPKLSLLVRNSNREALDFYRHLGYVQDEALSLGKRLILDGPA